MDAVTYPSGLLHYYILNHLSFGKSGYLIADCGTAILDLNPKSKVRDPKSKKVL